MASTPASAAASMILIARSTGGGFYFAKVSHDNDYCRPLFNEDGVVNLKELRHPVIEKLIEMRCCLF